MDPVKPIFTEGRGSGERLVSNELTASENELYIDRDIIVLASPEIAQLPNWVIALMAAEVCSGIVDSRIVVGDFLRGISRPDKEYACQECVRATRVEICADISSGLPYLLPGSLFYPPGFVAEVVAFAFGLAAASFFPAIVLGIFSRSQ